MAKVMVPEIENASIEEIHRITGSNPRTIRRWKNGTATPPESAVRLLKLFLDGNASPVLGKAWEGCILRDGLLYLPEWRRGFDPGELRAMFWRIQQVAALESEIRQLKKTLDRRDTEIDELEKKADFYRRQVTLESRFGMLLSQIFA